MESIPEIFKYITLLLYLGLTIYLSFIGMKKTKDLKGFSIGNKDMNPILIGVTLAASIASSATFMINPGFVYVHGLAAYLHYGVAAVLGTLAAFLLLTKGFRKIGAEHGSLTIPHWIRARYNSKYLALFFACINLLSIAFIVLILSISAQLVAASFGISQTLALTLCLLFTFSYILMGGTYAHAYTNALQGLLMIIISLFLFFSGWEYWQGGFFTNVQSIGQAYSSVYNPESNLYYDFFSVFGSGFLITFALMFQPHILTKIFYIKEDKDVNTFLITTILVGTAFSLMLFIGFYAKFAGMEVVRQDQVVIEYIHNTYSTGILNQCILAFITVTLLAAGMSTLDGILVALSSMIVNDIYLPFQKDIDEAMKYGLALSRYVLIVIGLIAFFLCIKPPQLLGIFAQQGVYGFASASFVPILVGVLYKRVIPAWLIFCAAMIGICGHLGLNLSGYITNPSVSSSISMLASLAFTLLFLIPLHFKNGKI